MDVESLVASILVAMFVLAITARLTTYTVAFGLGFAIAAFYAFFCLMHGEVHTALGFSILAFGLRAGRRFAITVEEDEW